MTESLYSGFPGVAWATEHLDGRVFETEGDDSLGAIDEALLGSLARSPWRGEIDVINGLAGLGIYALERLPRPAARQCLEQIVERLAELAERRDGLTAWFNPPERLPAFQREDFPDGLYNLGASHGIAGIIALLAAVCRAGVSEALAGSLLEGAVAWLLARRLDPGTGSRFDSFYHPAVPPRRSRLAWCYGDAGIAATLLVAGRAVGREDWQDEAVSLALAAAERPVATCGVQDAGLCHGASGLAHLFNRMFHWTGDERLRGAARVWIERTLAARQPGLGVAGFRSWAADLTGPPDWRDDPGWLEGASGIGLALLAATSTVEPAWDRLLLVGT
jgi:lantibiotic modifying enzyme